MPHLLDLGSRKHETSHMYADPYGVLRTDHELRLWGASAVRLHYRLEPAS